MSHIFDALQKAEAERTDSNNDLRSSVEEVLARAERRAAANPKFRPAEHSAKTPTFAEEAPVFTNVKGFTARSVDEVNISSDLAQYLSTPTVTVADQEREILLDHCRTLHPKLLPEWKFVSCTDSSSAAAEAFRLLTVRLRHIRKEQQLKRVLITSSVPQEGKSLTSANLAFTLSARGTHKVLLLEGDVHRPSLTQTFRLTNEPGLCEFLQGHSAIEDCIYRLVGPEIWILPAGQLPSLPLELIQSQSMPVLMERLDELFDWIIIDSPPILPMADTSILARLADGILLVTRRGVTEKHVLERGLQSLEKNKVVGAVVNSSRRHERDYHYYYGARGTRHPGKAIPPDSPLT